MLRRTAILASGLTALTLGACAQQEEEVFVPTSEPIYAKDGTIIGERPVVGAGGTMHDDTMMSDGNMMMSEEED